MPIHLTIVPPVARVVLDRPPLNVLDIPTMRELLERVQEAAAHPGITILLLEGAGSRAFSAGVEIRDHAPDRVTDMLRVFHATLRTLLALDCVTVAAVRGYALGGGCELAAICDFVIAAADAEFGQPEIDVGCYPPAAVVVLPRLIGRRRTIDLLLTGRHIGAREAHEMGLVTRVVAAGEVEAAVAELTAALASKSAAVLKLTRRAILFAEQSAIEAELARVEAHYLQDLMQTDDAREGIRAFLEKRKPAWTGR